MQDPTAFPPLKPHFPEQEQLKCPRCDSTNTKFCYYNNYNLSQPRHFCKNCRRYWTKGGALRNIPVGGGSRRNTKKAPSKKASSSSPSSSTSPSTSSLLAASTSETTVLDPPLARVQSNPIDQEKSLLNVSGSFSSLLAANGHYGSLLEGLNSSGSGVKMMSVCEMGDNLVSVPTFNPVPGRNTGTLQMQSNSHSESLLGIQTSDSSCWNNGSTWSGLAIFTSGSSLSVEAERGKGNYFV